jgi:hypothetical protein
LLLTFASEPQKLYKKLQITNWDGKKIFGTYIKWRFHIFHGHFDPGNKIFLG